MKTLTVLKVSPGCRPEVVHISHTLLEMQKLVGGKIEAIYPFEDPVAVVCNEEGKLTGEEPNRAIKDPNTGEIMDIICGTFFVCGLTREDFGSLDGQLIQKYNKFFCYPEMFLWNGSRLVVLNMVG